jgi:ABC-type multidrug transport system fused ATPase/permease subunit
MARLNARVRRRLFDAILSQDIGFFDLNKTGDLSSRLNNDCSTVRPAVFGSVLTLKSPKIGQNRPKSPKIASCRAWNLRNNHRVRTWLGTLFKECARTGPLSTVSNALSLNINVLLRNLVGRCRLTLSNPG